MARGKKLSEVQREGLLAGTRLWSRPPATGGFVPGPGRDRIPETFTLVNCFDPVARGKKLSEVQREGLLAGPHTKNLLLPYYSQA